MGEATAARPGLSRALGWLHPTHPSWPRPEACLRTQRSPSTESAEEWRAAAVAAAVAVAVATVDWGTVD